MKKILSVCLALCLAFTLAAPALAETVSLAPAALETAPVTEAPAAVTGEAGTPAMVGESFAAEALKGEDSPGTADELANAITNATSGVVTLDKDYNLDKSISITQSNIVVDLGGHTISVSSFTDSTSSTAINITGNGVTLRNGSIVDNRAKDGTPGGLNTITVNGNTASLTTENLVIQTYGPNTTTNNYNYLVRSMGGATVTISNGTQISDIIPEGRESYGGAGVTVWKDSKLYITGGSIETELLAVAGNGANNNGTVIDISGGTITSRQGTGIYHPQNGTLTISGGTITGDTAVEVRSGTVMISGDAHLIATGTFKNAGNGNGTTTSGAALAISQHSTNFKIGVTINGGTFEGDYAVFEKDVQDPTAPDEGKINVAITGGNFVGQNENRTAIKVETAHNKDECVTGGNFSSDVRAYAGENTATMKTENAETPFTLGEEETIAEQATTKVEADGKITYYANLSQALEETKDAGEAPVTVTVINDTDLGDAVIGEHVTVKVDNGVTLNVTGKVENNGAVKNEGAVTVQPDGELGGEVTGEGTVENIPEPEPIVPDTAVKLDKEALALEVGQTAKLNATVKPADADYKVVFWSTSDAAVADVSESGLVTAVAEGEAVITAESWYGNTASCTVTVTAPVEPEPDPDPEPEPTPEWPEEGLEGFVVRCYRVALGRDPDEAGFENWVNWLTDGTVDAKGCAYGFVFSAEMTNKGLSDEAFVKALYNLFMGREGEPTGVSFWVDYLADGHSRTEVFNGFADSIEFGRIVAGFGLESEGDITFPGL